MVGTGEGYFVGLSLELTLGYSLESQNTGAELPVTLLGESLGLWFVSEEIRCWCFCHRLMDFRKATCWGVGISFVPTYGALTPSNTNSVEYCQLLEFLTLEI